MGTDKAWLDWHGCPLWQVQLGKLSQLGASKLVVACRREQQLHSAIGIPSGIDWVFDPDGEDSGPLGAIHRVLQFVSMPVLALAVDMPLMTEEFMSDVICPKLSAHQGFFFKMGDYFEPMAACYAPIMLPLMKHHLHEHQFGLQNLITEAIQLDLASSAALPPEHQPLFENVNTPEALESGRGRQLGPAQNHPF
jgi:molybdopterin-guanine dinucleotide biosynthesis protein A